MILTVETDPETGMDRIVKIDPDNIAPVEGITSRPWFNRWNDVPVSGTNGRIRRDEDIEQIREDNR